MTPDRDYIQELLEEADSDSTSDLIIELHEGFARNARSLARSYQMIGNNETADQLNNDANGFELRARLAKQRQQASNN